MSNSAPSMVTVQQLGSDSIELAWQSGKTVASYIEDAGMTIGVDRQVNVNGTAVMGDFEPEAGAVISVAKHIANG